MSASRLLGESLIEGVGWEVLMPTACFEIAVATAYIGTRQMGSAEEGVKQFLARFFQIRFKSG